MAWVGAEAAMSGQGNARASLGPGGRATLSAGGGYPGRDVAAGSRESGKGSGAGRADLLVASIRRGLAEAADPRRAPGMQAYMKSAMPYRGVPAPAQRAVYRRLLAEHPLETASAWRRAVLALWREAAFREERYAAIELALAKRHAAFRTLEALPIFEEMIVDGAWWDYVDPVATRGIAELLGKEARRMRAVLVAWSKHDDMWKRRSAIIAQVSCKDATDLELLYACIEPNLSHRDFFVQKAIGWALRSYAWTDPDEVVRWVDEHESRLSGLSRREALKNVSSGKARGKRPARSAR
ncbi:MAG: DNA alkylation repair protein [Polyangiaceae bacterium]